MISVVIFPGVSAQTELGSWEIRKFQENLKTSQNFKEVWSRSNIHRIYTIYTTFFHFTHIVMFWLCILFSAPSGTLSEVSLNEWSNVQINSLRLKPTVLQFAPTFYYDWVGVEEVVFVTIFLLEATGVIDLKIVTVRFKSYMFKLCPGIMQKY